MHKFLRQFVTGCALFGGAIASANAADLKVKALPPPAPIIAPSWGGFYGGVHLGGSFYEDPDSFASMQRFTGGGTNPKPLQEAFGFNNNETSPFGGGQIGYNWQSANFVFGLEADISAAARSGGGRAILSEGPITYTVTGTSGAEWFGTIRGRVGVLVNPNTLIYATGGFAYGRAGATFVQHVAAMGDTFDFTSSSVRTLTGETVGGGLEYLLGNKWSLKAEYLLIWLHRGAPLQTTTIVFNPGQTGVFTVQGGSQSMHTARVGLNYRLGGGP